jgi:hypothetical protein
MVMQRRGSGPCVLDAIAINLGRTLLQHRERRPDRRGEPELLLFFSSLLFSSLFFFLFWMLIVVVQAVEPVGIGDNDACPGSPGIHQIVEMNGGVILGDNDTKNALARLLPS